jgi:hypothetical protein
MVSGGIPSLPAISSGVGSRPITWCMLRQLRTILCNVSMVATDKLPAIIAPHPCRKYDLTRPDEQASGLSEPYAVHRILAVADFNQLWKCCGPVSVVLIPPAPTWRLPDLASDTGHRAAVARGERHCGARGNRADRSILIRFLFGVPLANGRPDEHKRAGQHCAGRERHAAGQCGPPCDPARQHVTALAAKTVAATTIMAEIASRR